MPEIPEELVDFFEGGVSVLVGTRDSENVPQVARGVGVSVSKDRKAVTLYLHTVWAAKALANIAENGEVALGLSRPIDNTAIQVKGKCTGIVSPAADRSVAERYLAVYSEQLYMTGIPRSITRRFIAWPAAAVTFEVRDLFVQTPGPDAGKRLG